MAWLGFAKVATFMAPIVGKRSSALTVPIPVPLAFGLTGGMGSDPGDMVLSGGTEVAPTALMSMFSPLCFGLLRSRQAFFGFDVRSSSAASF